MLDFKRKINYIGINNLSLIIKYIKNRIILQLQEKFIFTIGEKSSIVIEKLRKGQIDEGTDGKQSGRVIPSTVRA